MDGKEISIPNSDIKFTLMAKEFVSKTERVPVKEVDVFNNLYVKNFPSKDYTEEELRKTFETFGKL